MSKYGGSEKTTQAFVAAYNKPRLSTCSIQAERPPGVLLRPGRTNPLPPSSSPLSSLAPSGPQSDVWWGCCEDRPRWMLQDSLRAPHRVAPPSSTTCCPNKSRALCPLTLFFAQEQHAVLWCAPAPPAPLRFSASLQPTTGTQ